MSYFNSSRPIESPVLTRELWDQICAKAREELSKPPVPDNYTVQPQSADEMIIWLEQGSPHLRVLVHPTVYDEARRRRPELFPAYREEVLEG